MWTKLLIPLLLLTGCGGPPATVIDLKEQSSTNKKPVEIVALQYVGFTERTHRAQLKELTGVDPVRVEWCAAFVNAVLAESGIEGSEAHSNYPLTAKSFLGWGQSVKKPEPGDIVIFPRGTESWQGHVGFYLRSQIIKGVEYYYILGGNQNNKVSVQLFRASTAISIRRQILI